MTAIIVSLPREQWEILVPSALLFPVLLWVSVRCRPFFAAAGAFLVCFNIVWMTVFGVGYFGDSAFSLADRIARAQANMLVVAIGALVLAVLFAERRENEAHLARANRRPPANTRKRLFWCWPPLLPNEYGIKIDRNSMKPGLQVEITVDYPATFTTPWSN
jgi:hypothetical protein